MLELYFDGLCEPRNPGGVACWGYVLRENDSDPQCVLESHWRTVAGAHGVAREGPEATNNVAEWVALGKGLRYILDNYHGCPHLTIYGDSQLVIRQLNQEWRCNKPHLQQYLTRCHEILSGLTLNWRALPIPKEDNQEARAESSAAYLELTGREAPAR